MNFFDLSFKLRVGSSKEVILLFWMLKLLFAFFKLLFEGLEFNKKLFQFFIIEVVELMDF